MYVGDVENELWMIKIVLFVIKDDDYCWKLWVIIILEMLDLLENVNFYNVKEVEVRKLIFGRL